MISYPDIWKPMLLEIGNRLARAASGEVERSPESDTQAEQDIFIGFHILKKLLDVELDIPQTAYDRRIKNTFTLFEHAAKGGVKANLSERSNALALFNTSEAQQTHPEARFICDSLHHSLFFMLDFDREEPNRLNGFFFNTKEQFSQKMHYLIVLELVGLLTHLGSSKSPMPCKSMQKVISELRD